MGLATVHTDVKTFLKTGSVTRLSDWPMSEGGVRERTRYGCPEEVFEHDYDPLVKALTIVAGDRETAADAVQEAFVRLVRGWERLATYEDPAGLGATSGFEPDPRSPAVDLEAGQTPAQDRAAAHRTGRGSVVRPRALATAEDPASQTAHSRRPALRWRLDSARSGRSHARVGGHGRPAPAPRPPHTAGEPGGAEMNDDRQLEERLRRLSWPVDHGGVWASIEARAHRQERPSQERWESATQADRRADLQRRAIAPRRRTGLRVAVFASIAVVLIAAVAFGSFMAVRNLAPPHFVLAITDDNVVGTGGQTMTATPSGQWEHLPLSSEGGCIIALVIDPQQPIGALRRYG